MTTRWAVDGAFGLANLRRLPWAAPDPGPGEVRLAMSAWSLNYRDLLMARGVYDPRIALPYTVLSDGVGRVTAVGAGVRAFDIGDRVCPTFSPSWIAGAPDLRAVRFTRGGPAPGVLAEELTLHESEVVRVPDALSDAEAACLPCAGVTAWSALVEHGRVTAGHTVLILGSGGVSLFALQLARSLGARVAAVTSDASKRDRLEAMGAAATWSSAEEPQWGRVVRAWSDGGVDLVVDVGGASTLAQSIDAVRVGGAVAVVGNLGGAEANISVLPLFMRQIRCQGVFVGSRRSFHDLCRALEVAPVRPTLARMFAYAEAAAAFEAFAAGGHFGKVALVAG